MKEDRKHIVWTAEKANRLYDFRADTPQAQNAFWAYQMGGAVVHLCDFFVDNMKKCEVLDYGCGMGHLMNRFLKKKVDVSGVDMSEREVAFVNRKYASNPHFKGVNLFEGGVLPFDDDTFDLITCTECIEHMMVEHIDGVLNEIGRILKPGGIVVFTTPNEEIMEAAEMCCPECNTVFHIHGHVRTFSVRSLTELMEKHNFTTIKCAATDFTYIDKYLHRVKAIDLSPRIIYRRAERALLNLRDIRTRKTVNSLLLKKYTTLKHHPHLFYVGTKG